MRNSLIDIQPIAGALGAEVGGVDVAEDLDDAVISEIRQALLDYGVIFFRDQTLDVARAKAFTRRFGAIFIHPNYKGVSADPEIVDMVAGPQAGMNAQRSTKVREDADWRETISVHPVVRTHPETGRKLLL
jgi:alpha-ketoglutarate-dependent taurine dioxygenase